MQQLSYVILIIFYILSYMSFIVPPSFYKTLQYILADHDLTKYTFKEKNVSSDQIANSLSVSF